MSDPEFDALVEPVLPKLRGVIRRMVGNASDTDDLVQETLLRAFEKRDTFRGDAAFSTWLISIGTRATLNLLRSRKRWRWDAQVHIAKHLHSTDEGKAALGAIFTSDEHRFEAREHIAFCFTCVGRSLPPDEQAALILRDVLEYSNREAARILDVTESVLRHSLASARKTMQSHFDDLCGIVNKNGVCHQCKGLRNVTPEGRRGPELPELGAMTDSAEERRRVRLRVVQGTNIDSGATQGLHDFVWQALERYEAAS